MNMIKRPLPYWRKLLKQKEIRENRTINYDIMAREIGITKQYLSTIMRSLDAPNKRIVDIAIYLDTTPEALRSTLLREAQEKFNLTK